MMVAVIFDLDYTLYDTEQFFSGAFNEIAAHMSKKHSLDKKTTYKRLIKIWKEKTSMYPFLFDDFLKETGHLTELNNIIQIFNNYCGKLEAYPETTVILQNLKSQGYRLGLVTDGNVERQKRKIRLLGLKNFFEVIIFVRNLGYFKTSSMPFRKALKKLNETPKESFCVGDNPALDFEGAKKAGMKTIRVLGGEFKELPTNKYVDYEINSLKELLEVVSNG